MTRAAHLLSNFTVEQRAGAKWNGPEPTGMSARSLDHVIGFRIPASQPIDSPAIERSLMASHPSSENGPERSRRASLLNVDQRESQCSPLAAGMRRLVS
jgi:hypothetical protein